MACPRELTTKGPVIHQGGTSGGSGEASADFGLKDGGVRRGVIDRQVRRGRAFFHRKHGCRTQTGGTWWDCGLTYLYAESTVVTGWRFQLANNEKLLQGTSPLLCQDQC